MDRQDDRLVEIEAAIRRSDLRAEIDELKARMADLQQRIVQLEAAL